MTMNVMPGVVGAEEASGQPVPQIPDETSPMSDLLRSLGEPTRLAIVAHLLHGEHRVTDLVAHLHLAQSTVSVHVACLRDCGLLSSRVRGRATYYSLAEPDQTKALLHAASVLLSATSGAASSCDVGGAQA